MDFYDNFGKSYDREATRTTEEDQVKLEDSWYGQPDEKGKTRWMGNPNNVAKVAQAVAIGAPLAAAAPIMAPAIVSTLANPYVAGGLNAYFAGHGINEFSDPNSLTRKSMSRAYDDPTSSNIGDAAWDVSMNSLNFVGLPFSKAFQGSKNVIKGYKQVPKKLPGSPNVVSSVDDVVKQPWQIEELPGLHLQSTMEGEAISKIVDKTGKINTEQALAIIAKESGGADKVALIKQGLGETIPKKMDFNDFRKITQEQLIPLEKQFSEQASNYGLGKIGYPSPKRSSFKSAIENNKLEIARLEEEIAKNPKVTAEDIDKLNFTRYSLKLSKKHLLTTEEQFSKLPLENQTLILSNKNKFGTGSSAHDNPEETLGHIHFLRDAQHPDIAIATQIQSDAFQGTHRIMPQIFNKEKELENLVKLENIAKIQKETAKNAKQISDDIFEFPDGLKIDKTTLENIGKTQKEYNAMKKAEIENFTQKSLLDKNHQERYLQEFMDYAGKRGDLNYIAIPKSETAAKAQGYFKTQKNNANKGDIVTLNNGTTGTIFAKSDNAMVIKHSDGTMENIKLEYVDPKDLFGNMTFPIKNVNGKPFEVHRSYSPEQQTILKKYTEYEKMAKKLGWETNNITVKGNEYTKIKIPKKFKEGKGEIKAFSTIGTGVLGLGLGATQYKQGGVTNDYVDVELTPEEVKNLIAQGYVLEALN
jgi:preprotein translocase subunit YajC